MHMCQTTMKSFKIVSKEWYLYSNTNATNCHFGFINRIENSVYKITNHILLIFILHFYKRRERGTLELSRLINEIKKVKVLETKSAQNHIRKLEQNNIKLKKTHRTIKV